jgi:hypothetical protein
MTMAEKIVYALKAADFSIGEQPKRRQRKPRLDCAIAQAEKAGKRVSSITTPDGVTLTFGQGEPTEAGNEWDEALCRGKH